MLARPIDKTDIFGYLWIYLDIQARGDVAAAKKEGKQMNGLKEYMVRYIPADDRYCTEKTIFVFAADRLDAINRTLAAEPVEKFIAVKL